MNYFSSEEVNLPAVVPLQLIRDKGIHLLDKVGANEIAWRYEDVFKIIDLLENENCRISGGDVYAIVGDNVEITYDNWSIDHNNLSWKENVLLGAKKARAFILQYHDQNPDKEFLYVLVVRANTSS